MSLLRRLASIPPVSFELDKEASNVLSTKSSVTPGTNAVCLYYSLTTPPPDGIDMHIEQVSYLTCGQHSGGMLATCHILLSPLFNYPITTITYLTSPYNRPNGVISVVNIPQGNSPNS